MKIRFSSMLALTISRNRFVIETRAWRQTRTRVGVIVAAVTTRIVSRHPPRASWDQVELLLGACLEGSTTLPNYYGYLLSEILINTGNLLINGWRNVSNTMQYWTQIEPGDNEPLNATTRHNPKIPSESISSFI